MFKYKNPHVSFQINLQERELYWSREEHCLVCSTMAGPYSPVYVLKQWATLLSKLIHLFAVPVLSLLRKWATASLQKEVTAPLINHTLMRKTKKSAWSNWLKLLGHVTTEENSRSKILLHRQSPVVYLRSAAIQLLWGPSKTHWLWRWGRTWGTQVWCPSPCHTTWPAAGPASGGRTACKGSLTWTKPP